MKILAIETSCDDTSAAILDDYKVLSNITLSQNIHFRFGGVVPELASRDHLTNIIKIIKKTLVEAASELPDIDLIAYTRGPGLLGGLLVGGCVAKSIGLALKKKVLGVNHLEGHVLSPFLDVDPSTVIFPFISLVVSGGHTLLVYVSSFECMKIIGSSLDDAVGEAFDKIGKVLDLGYPAGELIDSLAKTGDPFVFKFPKTNVPSLNMSFSGIKTAFSLFIKKNLLLDKNFIENNKADICASIQHSLIAMCVAKLCRALDTHKVAAISISGGVAANSYLRKCCEKIACERNLVFYVPHKKFATDNAAMIGLVGYYTKRTDLVRNTEDMLVDPKLPLGIAFS